MIHMYKSRKMAMEKDLVQAIVFDRTIKGHMWYAERPIKH